MTLKHAAPEFDPSGPAVYQGIFGLPSSPEDSSVILVPVPWEATASYGLGTAKAPAAIFRASWQVELFDLDVGEPWQAGIAMLDPEPDIIARNEKARSAAQQVMGAPAELAARAERGNCCELVNQCSDWLNQQVRTTVSQWLDRGKLVGTIGGDHSTAYGCIAAHAARFPGLGILQFDAHADLREAYQGFRFSHASTFHNVLRDLPEVARLVQVGVRDLCEEEYALIQSSPRLETYFDSELARRQFDGEPFNRIAQQIAASLPPEVYVSFDIDGLNPALCPHTGTPVPGGLSFQQAVAILNAVCVSGRRIVGFDLCEVAPGANEDEGDEWDANVAARLLYKLIGYALGPRKMGAPLG